MTEQSPDTHVNALRSEVTTFFSDIGLPIGHHEGATVVERPRYSKAILDFMRAQSGEDPPELLLTTAARKLKAMTVLRTSPHSKDRVDFRAWRAEVISNAWLSAYMHEPTTLALDVAKALAESNAREAAEDALVAVILAAEEIDQVPLQD